MKVPVRLGLYGLVLVVVFAVAAFVASAVVPGEFVQNWLEDAGVSTQSEGHTMNDDNSDTGDNREDGSDHGH